MLVQSPKLFYVRPIGYRDASNLTTRKQFGFDTTAAIVWCGSARKP
jgi:hypothetical protein